MKRYLTGIGILIALTVGAAETPEKDGQSAAESWLSIVDSGKRVESWNALATPARQAIGQWRWRIGFARSQAELGTLRDRRLRSAKFSDKSPSGRSGQFVFLEFDTISSKKGLIVEKLATMREPDGIWRVVTYHVD